MTMNRRSIVIAGVAVVVVASSVLLRARPTPERSASSAHSSELTVVQVSSAPAGPNAQDAVIEAERVIRSTGEIATAGFITRGDLIRSIATERFGSELAAASSRQLAEMTEALGAASVAAADLVWVEYPLTSRLVRASATEAVVDVWSVLVVGVPDVGAPRQVWRTVTMTMRWEHGAWRVHGWSTGASGVHPTNVASWERSVCSVHAPTVIAFQAWPGSSMGSRSLLVR